MGTIHLPEKVKLFIGVISNDRELVRQAGEILEDKYGLIDMESGFIDFTQTCYYEKEMGKDLRKKFFCFKELIKRELIIDVKLFTNELELALRKNKDLESRDINLDPGYMSLANVTLATTKDYRHRVYLGRGIFLENTLYYDAKAKSFVDWEWTYPDFCQQQYKEFFLKIREVYKQQLRGRE